MMIKHAFSDSFCAAFCAALFVSTLLATPVAHAAEKTDAAHVWVRATVMGQKVTGGFMTLTAKDDARLIAVSSPAAGYGEVHEMAMENNFMKMRAVNALPLPKNKTLELKPGGFHVMLFDLKKPLQEGEKLPLILKIEHADKSIELLELTAQVAARAPDAQADNGKAHQHVHK